MKDVKEEKKKGFSDLYGDAVSRARALFGDQKRMTVLGLRLLRGGIALLFSYILSSGAFAFGALPFGVAFLAATRKDFLFIWIGAVCAAAQRGDNLPAEMLALGVLLAVKLYFSSSFSDKTENRRGEPIVLSVTLAMLAEAVIGVGQCIAEGFSVYALFGLLTSLLAGGVAAFLFCGYTVSGIMSRLYRRAGGAALLFSLIYCVGEFTFFSFSPNLALAVTATLFFAEQLDLLSVGVLGAILGLACGLEMVLPLTALALVSAAVHKYSSKAAPWLGILAAFSIAFYDVGNSAFLYVLPDMVCGALICIPVRYYSSLYQRKTAERFKKENTQSASSSPAESMRVLSENLSIMSDKLRTPTKEEAFRICNDSLDKICTDCGKGCFKEERRVRAIADSLFETGILGAPLTKDNSFSGCGRWQYICDEINNEYCARIETLYRCDRAGCYANCYKSLSKALLDRDKRDREATMPMEDLIDRFKKALYTADVDFEEASACGKRETVFTVRGIQSARIGARIKAIRETVERGCAVALGMPELKRIDGKDCLTFKRVANLKADVGALSEKKPGEEVCGDAMYSFVYDHYFYLLLSDGMGSGRDAALASGMVCHFAKELFSIGASIPTVLETVNDFLLYQNFECSATFDLMRLDLFDGSCDFVKSGACPSLVIRGDNTFRVASLSVPVGATKEVNCEKISLKLKSGDRIIFFTDGIASAPEEAPWLEDLLSGKLRKPVKETAEDLLRLSKQGKYPDDRSVAVVEIDRC